MSSFDLKEHSHRRYNPLTQEWVQVSPHRSKRPWQGQVEKAETSVLPAHDPSCYLCAGNVRANGEKNPDYISTYSFTNDFAALMPVPEGGMNIDDLLIARSESGICRVICFSPRHDLTVAEMDVKEIANVIGLWIKECSSLGVNPSINHIQIFENKGAVMGCSNPHPHGQIWAQDSIPGEVEKKSKSQLNYFKQKNNTLLSDYLRTEKKFGERIVFENDHFIVAVPFWAVWPYETIVIPKRPMARITQMNEEEQYAFADAYKAIAVRYDNLFEVSFPYSAGIHQAPFDGEDHPEWHWHMVFYPPLLRSASVKKFMVGYEMLANPQRDVTPEFSAERLREVPGIHYKSMNQ